MIPYHQLSQLKVDCRCDEIAGKWVELRRRGSKMTGPCPLCGGAKGNERFVATGDGWMCAVCRQGGDVIKLVMLHQDLDFRAAVEWLGGPHEVDEAEAQTQAKARAAREEKRKADEAFFRERDRKRHHDIWTSAKPAAGSPVQSYLDRRGLILPQGARLRHVAGLPFYDGEEIGEDGRKHARLIGRADGMIAAVVGNDGKFKSLHRTWVDLAQPKGKAVFIDPDTLEPIKKTKKYAGSTAAGHIEIVGPAAPRQLIVGEGVETVLATYTALAASGRDLSATAFWTSLDLGNLGGRALDKIGRYPGPTPDPEAPAIALPDSVEDVVVLGDHDSDPTLTRCAIYRASMRWARDKRTIRVAWAPKGKDFNDLLMVA